MSTHHPEHALDAGTVALDATSTARVASLGLEYRPPDGDTELDGFLEAVRRGFLDTHGTDEARAAWRSRQGDNRLVGVWDPAGTDRAIPIATVNGWVMNVTVDVDRLLPMWSISAVTVSPTHRRRGIARALLEGELRAAADAGLPIAGLTVSEATIYGRYGFGPAADAATVRIENRRAGWLGPRLTAEAGRLDPIDRETLASDLTALNDRTAARRPGQVSGWPHLGPRLAGTMPKLDDAVRGVRFSDADGEVRGAVAYSVKEDADDFTKSVLTVRALIAETDEAYAALWQYLLEHDLIGTTTAELRSLDEPLRWLIADQRALSATVSDHHWLRILDVERCLAARRFHAPGAVQFSVSDDLGIAEGTWRVDVDAEGAASVSTKEADDDLATVRLGVSELSSLLLGGARASTLRAADRVHTDAATAEWLDVALSPVTTPVLNYWY